MSAAATEVDVVKRGYLRYKTASTGGTLVALQAKGFKEYWFLFRAQKKIKVLEYYGSEKDSNKKNASPRGVVQLHQIRSVGWGDSDRQKQFILYSSDGSHHYLDAPSVYEANEWITALNSVLFAKGPDGGQVIQFNVEVWDSALLNYSGGGILEVRDGQLIVWSVGNHREVVRWKLGHIRSFKAKHNQLHILAGSRSSTGEGIFVFGTQQSVLITHTLETVIEMLAKQKKERQGAPVQHLPPAGGSFAPRVQLPGVANLSTQQKLPHPPVPEPYHGTLSHSVVPGFSDIPPGHHDLDSQDGAYNRLSYHDDLDDGGPSYSHLGRVSQRPKLHSPQPGAHSSTVQPTSTMADYSSLHPTATNRSSSNEELDTTGGIYSDISDDAAYNRLGVNPFARTGEDNYAEVKNTSPNLQARGARPGSYNALRGVEVGVVDHSQHPPPLYSFPESGDGDEGQYSQLQNATAAPPPSRPGTSGKHAPPNTTLSNPDFFDSRGSVALDPVSQHYEVSPAASPTMQAKFMHAARQGSFEPEDSAEEFYYELARKNKDGTTATRPVSDTANYQGLYSSLHEVTITGASPYPNSDKREQNAEHNPNPDLRQPAKVPLRSGPAEGPPVPPRRSNNPDQFPTQPHLHNTSTDGASNRPHPPVAPKPRPRK